MTTQTVFVLSFAANKIHCSLQKLTLASTWPILLPFLTPKLNNTISVQDPRLPPCPSEDAELLKQSCVADPGLWTHKCCQNSLKQCTKGLSGKSGSSKTEKKIIDLLHTRALQLVWLIRSERSTCLLIFYSCVCFGIIFVMCSLN